MMKAQYEAVSDKKDEPLVIRDVGIRCRSVTNDMENVLEDLVKAGILKPGRKFFYYDSDNWLTEVILDNNCRLVAFNEARKTFYKLP